MDNILESLVLIMYDMFRKHWKVACVRDIIWLKKHVCKVGKYGRAAIFNNIFEVQYSLYSS